MKKVIVSFLASFLLSGSVFATEVVLSERTVTLPVDISTTKLKLSQSDYASPMVKVLVPELADVTLLNHRNTGEGAPCLATYDTQDPQEVIQNKPSVEQIPFTVRLMKYVGPTADGKKCEVTLNEIVEGSIRGFKFEHFRFLTVGERDLADCR